MAEPLLKAARGRRRLIVIVVGMGVLVLAAGWFFFNGLPLPTMAADRATLLNAGDLEPWVPGLSTMRGSESFRKKMTFLFGWGVDLEYNFENAREAAVPFSHSSALPAAPIVTVIVTVPQFVALCLGL